MITSECILSPSNKRKRFLEKIALVWRDKEDPFGDTEWPNFHIRQHIQKNANRVFCAACLGLVQVQPQRHALKKAIYRFCGCLGDTLRSRALFKIAVSWNAAHYTLPYQ